MPTPRSLGGISSQYVTYVQSPVIHQVCVDNCKFSGEEYPAPNKITQQVSSRLPESNQRPYNVSVYCYSRMLYQLS